MTENDEKALTMTSKKELAELTSEVESRLKLESAGAMEECVCEAVGGLDGETVNFECTYKMREEVVDGQVPATDGRSLSKAKSAAKRPKEGVVSVSVP